MAIIIDNAHFLKALWPSLKAVYDQFYPPTAMTNLSIQPGLRPSFTLGDYVAFCCQGSSHTTHVGRISGINSNFHFEIEGKHYTGSGWAPLTWTSGAEYLRYMTYDEVCSLVPDHLANVCVQPDGTVRPYQVLYVTIKSTQEVDAAQPEDRIGLRREEIDWDAHRDFMRGL